MNRVRGVLALSLVIACGVILYSGSLFGRITGSLAHSRQCLYDLVTRGVPSASVVVTGSSRARQSVDSQGLARGLGLAPGSAFNVSHPSNNPWLDIVIAEQAIKSPHLRLIMIEAQVGSRATRRADAERKGKLGAARETVALASGIQAEPALASLDTAALARLAEHIPPLMLRFYDALYVAKYKLEMGLKTLLATNLLRHMLVGDKDMVADEATTCLPKRLNASKTGAPKHARIKAERTEAFHRAYPGGWSSVPDDGVDFLSDPETALDRSAMKEIVALARSRNVAVVFFYLPSLYTPPPAENIVSAFARDIGASLLVPDRTTLSDLHPYYYDSTHLNLDGRRLFTQWLVGKLERDVKT